MGPSSHKRPVSSHLQYSSKILKHWYAFSASAVLIWVLQSSQCSKIRVAQHWGRRGAHLSKKKSAMIVCKKQCLFQRFVVSIVASIQSLRSMDRSFQARSFHLILHPVIPLRDLQLMRLMSTVK